MKILCRMNRSLRAFNEFIFFEKKNIIRYIFSSDECMFSEWNCFYFDRDHTELFRAEKINEFIRLKDRRTEFELFWSQRVLLSDLILTRYRSVSFGRTSQATFTYVDSSSNGKSSLQFY